jgi:Tfp pilus assembly protein PilF
LAPRLNQNALISMASKTILRGRSRALALVPVALVLLAATLVAAGCGTDVGRLTDESLALVGAGRFDEALPIQERVAALDPKDAQIRVELGFNYLSHQNNPAKAVAAFKQAVYLDPSAKYSTFLAQAYIGAGDAKTAETVLRQAIGTDKSYGHSYTVLLALLEEQGRTTEAAAVREAAASAGVTLAPENVQ